MASNITQDIDPVLMPSLEHTYPEGLRRAATGIVDTAQNVAGDVLSIPKHIMESSESLRTTGAYDPAPAATLMQLMSGQIPGAEAGAAGIFGGRLAADNLAALGMEHPRTALHMAEHMHALGTSPEDIYAITSKMLEDTPWGGVSMGKDGQWRFEMPESQLPENAPPPAAPVPQVPQGIRAYHGSPYDFDKFDINKIGTGEGAQAYGHGLYFAENEAVARGYQEGLAGGVTVNGQPYDVNNPVHLAASLVRDLGSTDRAINDLEARAKRDPGDFFQRAINYLKNAKELPVVKSDRGSIYNVRIDANPEQFLDWDKPLSEQPDMLRKILPLLPKEEAVRFERLAGINTQGMDIQSPTFSSVHRALSDQLGGQDKATDALRQAGIPGIKYLDEGSRGAGDGTRNYVVFDPSIIDIVKKYGLAGLIGAGAAHFSLPDDKAPTSGVPLASLTGAKQ